MAAVAAAALLVALGATHEVPAGGDVSRALAAAHPGDVVRLGPGEHRASLGRLAGVRIAGAGAGVTSVLPPEGEDGVVATGEIALEGLSIHAGPGRCALKVLGGAARLSAVALSGGSCAAFVSGGRLDAVDVLLRGGYGLLVERGEATVEGGSVRGEWTGVGVLAQGAVTLRRVEVHGPSAEGGVSVAGGAARLEGVVVRAPGPSGISVSAGGRVDAFDVTIAGAATQQGMLGDCVQVIRGSARMEASTLVRCGGAALEASGGEVALTGVDLSGGSAGCIALVAGARADLVGNLCAGRGPGLVAASGARARTRAGRWWTDPVLWVECASGARVEIGPGEGTRQPCAGIP